MSWWTYINGSINVTSYGRTTEESEYIIKTVLRHLPKVTGSERNMQYYVIKSNYYTSNDYHNEFGEPVEENQKEIDTFIIVVEGNLRDRSFEQTLKEFNKWICRLSKKVWINNITVSIGDYNKKIILSDEEPYTELYDEAHTKYLRWEPNEDSLYPKNYYLRRN